MFFVKHSEEGDFATTFLGLTTRQSRKFQEAIEKAASRQAMDHVDSNYLREPLQSSYKRHHSTEAALLKVKNDLLCSLDNNKAALIFLLDMSAAFDTVDHDILLDRLESKFGIKHMVKSWFPPTSEFALLKCLLMVISLMTMLWDIPCRRDQSSALTGLYYIPPLLAISCVLLISLSTPMLMINNCMPSLIPDLKVIVNEINEWMIQNTLRLNQDKTEFFLIANRNVSAALSGISLKLGIRALIGHTKMWPAPAWPHLK